MQRLKVAALGALLGGLSLFVYAAMQGSVRVGLFLIIPFVYATGAAAALGMLLVMTAIGLWIFAKIGSVTPLEADLGTAADRDTKRKSGGVVLLGPIPIVWGSEARVLPWMIVAGAALLVLTLFVSWLLR